MRNSLAVFVVVTALLVSLTAASRANQGLHAASAIAMKPGFARVVPQPQMEEPRGPDVFVWYCCNGVRFHSISVNSGGAVSFVELDWGLSYQSVAVRLPNCRDGSVTMAPFRQGLGSDGGQGQYHYYDYNLSGTLRNGVSMANCDVVADVYQNGHIVNSQDFRVMIQ